MTNANKKIIVFGATGGTGKQIVKQALDMGYDVSVFVRGKSESLGELAKKVIVYKGDARDYLAVEKSIIGQDAVLVALGAVPGKKDSILTISTNNIINAMKKCEVKRLIVETGAGLIEDKKQLPLLWRLTSSFPPMKVMFDDKRSQEEAVRESNLDWIIVRPSNLSNVVFSGSYIVGESIRLKVSSKVSRANVADFMVKQLIENKWLQKAVIIQNK